MAGKVVATQNALARSYLKTLCGVDGAEELGALRSGLMQTQGQFGEMLLAAESDNYEIRESRANWHAYKRRSGELETRHTQIKKMLDGQMPDSDPVAVDLKADPAVLEKLQAYERAAFEVTASALRDLQSVTGALWEAARKIQGNEPAEDASAENPATHFLFIPDPDRMAASLRLIVAMWAAYLTVIYVPDLPGGWSFVTLVSVFSIILVGTPQLPVGKLFAPIPASLLFGAAMYIWIMPQLSSFIGLGVLIFLVTFGICYRFSAPQQALMKTFGSALFLAIISVSCTVIDHTHYRS